VSACREIGLSAVSNSAVCDKNTRRGDGRLPDMTHSISARTPLEYTNFQATACPLASTGRPRRRDEGTKRAWTQGCLR
jgi:hypothetical protein